MAGNDFIQNDEKPVLIAVSRKSNLANQAYDALHDAIITGRIKRGEHLGQASVARQLGISERTVREAFLRLVARGLAQHEPYKGITVTTLPFVEIAKLYHMRTLIECYAMELSVKRISEEEIQRMYDFLLPPTLKNGYDPQQAQDFNHEFHWTYIRACGSKMVEKELEGLWDQIYSYGLSLQTYKTEEYARQDDEQHRIIINALEKRDAELATKVTRMHLESTVELLANIRNIMDEDVCSDRNI